MTLTDLIATFKDNQNIAIRYRTDFRTFTYTYAELYQLIQRMAAFLDAQKIGPGDRVLICGPNSPAWATAFLGTIYCGAIAVPADIFGTTEMITAIGRLSGAKFIIKTKYKPALPLDVPSYYLEDLLHGLSSQVNSRQPFTAQADDIAELVYTSGTTGVPKGVMLSHRNIMTNVKDISEVVSISSKDTMLSTLPLSHMFEQTAGFFTPLYAGARIVYITSLKQSALLGALSNEKVTVILTVPRFLQSLRDGILAKAAGQNRA